MRSPNSICFTAAVKTLNLNVSPPDGRGGMYRYVQTITKKH